MIIVAEVGINHNGDIEIARQLMCMAKKAGADYVKYQKRDIDTVYTKEFLDGPRESPWGSTQRHQKEGLEFNYEQYQEIDRYSKEIHLPWFASCWDLKSLDFIREFRPELYKIASPMITNIPFITRVASLGHKTLISCGMSEWSDIDRAVMVFKQYNCPFVLMHCISEYPCPDEHVNLKMIHTLKERYGCEVGYSNHSSGIESCVGAAYLGATFIECHVTLDRSMYGSDQSASLEKRGLELVCKYAKNAQKIIGDGVRIVREAEKVNSKKLRYWDK